MRRFERSDEATDGLASDRLESATKALYDALVPPEGECVSVQGELVRANERLFSEHLRNGMGNYYNSTTTFASGYYTKLLVFLLDTLIDNRGGALDDDDVQYFAEIRRLAEPDWVRTCRLGNLEDSETELSEAENQELEALLAEEQQVGQLPWYGICARAQRCIANWCLVNPALIDRRGQPVTERGIRDLTQLVDR